MSSIPAAPVPDRSRQQTAIQARTLDSSVPAPPQPVGANPQAPPLKGSLSPIQDEVDVQNQPKSQQAKIDAALAQIRDGKDATFEDTFQQWAANTTSETPPSEGEGTEAPELRGPADALRRATTPSLEDCVNQAEQAAARDGDSTVIVQTKDRKLHVYINEEPPRSLTEGDDVAEVVRVGRSPDGRVKVDYQEHGAT